MAKMKNDKKVLIRIENLKQWFPLRKASVRAEQLYVRANDDITLDIYEGETLGLVGESGCGKSTLGRTLLQIYTQTDGRTIYYGRGLDEIAPKYVTNTLKNLKGLRKDLEDAKEDEKKAKEAYESCTDDEEKYKLLAEHREAEKLSKKLYMSMVQLIGAFMLADDLDPVSDIFMKENEMAIQARKIRMTLADNKAKLEAKKSVLKNKGKSNADIEAATASIRAAVSTNEQSLQKMEADLKGIEKKISEMVQAYKNHPDFERLEQYRDKGVDIAKLTVDEMKLIRKDMQLIFQDPYSSLNPRMTVGQIISEGLYTHKMFDRRDDKAQDYILETMEKCGLAKYFVHRYPHQFSGGQRQRIGIARSVALKPKFIVCDEAVSALDVSIQSQVINLLLDLKEQENLTYLFISHDLSVIKYISDRVGVMYLGNIVELAPTQDLYNRPMHPYTEALLLAIPTTDTDVKKEAYVLEGDIPSPIRPPKGCKFHTRCRYVTDICKNVQPLLEEVTEGHFVACHHKLNQ